MTPEEQIANLTNQAMEATHAALAREKPEPGPWDEKCFLCGSRLGSDSIGPNRRYGDRVVCSTCDEEADTGFALARILSDEADMQYLLGQLTGLRSLAEHVASSIQWLEQKVQEAREKTTKETT